MSRGAPALLELRDVSARYGGLEALKGVSLSVGEGQRVAVLGHNGAGKTTLLKCVVGAVTETSGTITCGATRIVPGEVYRNARLGIGFVPQGHNVFKDLTVEQNLTIAGLLHGADLVARAYELFPVLWERHAQFAGSMSGGEQQMLALGMALMTKPRVLLLDEPTTGLAPVVVGTVLGTLRKINETMHTALVIVEQNVQATLRLVERAVVLKSGRVIFDGPSAELLAHEDLWAWF